MRRLKQSWPRMPIRIAALAVTLVAVLAGSVQAHFQLEARNRVFIVEPAAEGVRVYLRVPTTLVYTAYLAARERPADRVDAPFIVADATPRGFLHRLDATAISGDWQAFGRLVADGYRFTAAEQAVTPLVTALRVHGAVDAPPFATPGEARAALDGPLLPDAAGMYVGETVVDVALVLPGIGADVSLTVVGTLPELSLPADIVIDNHFVDFRHGGHISTVPGQLVEPVPLDRTAWQAAATFVVEGIRHIVGGFDHVLFVLCLSLAATRVGMLVWQVTGFTVGHSLSLMAGFLGFVPTAAWFVPAVEAAIALSIIYAAAMAIKQRPTRASILVTAAIGVLHGFGFAFVLQLILSPAAPHLAVSLLSFNAGVEAGQLAIVAGAAGGLALLTALNRAIGRYSRLAVAGVAIAIAGVWTVDRLRSLGDIIAGPA